MSVLDPSAEKAVSAEDREAVLLRGILVMDLSWKHIDAFRSHERHQASALPTSSRPTSQLGKPMRLSSAEAVGRPSSSPATRTRPEACCPSSPSEQFLALNKEPLERYAAAATSAEVVEIQSDYVQ